VLYQTIYLVATAMGLAACANRSALPPPSAQAGRPDYYAESSVGELLLGSTPPGW